MGSPPPCPDDAEDADEEEARSEDGREPMAGVTDDVMMSGEGRGGPRWAAVDVCGWLQSQPLSQPQGASAEAEARTGTEGSGWEQAQPLPQPQGVSAWAGAARMAAASSTASTRSGVSQAQPLLQSQGASDSFGRVEVEVEVEVEGSETPACSSVEAGPL